MRFSLFATYIFAGTYFLQACSSGDGKDKIRPTKKTEAPVPVEVLVAKNTSWTNPIEVSGSLQAGEFVELRPDASGKIVFLNIPEGNFVAQGTILARLYNDDLQAQLKKNQVQLDLAKKNEERLKKLLEIGGINQQDYDQALSQVQSLQADAELIQAQIRKTIVSAPFSGKIGLRQVSLGAYVSPNNVIGTLQNTQIKVDFNVPEQYLNKVKIGETVSVFVEGFNKPLEAKIIAYEPSINTLTRNLKVRATLQDAPPSVFAGMFAKVMLGANEKKESILVPSSAIIPETRGKKLALIKNGKVEFAMVETGIRNESQVQVLSGIKVGDTIALTGLLFLKPNSPVSIKKVK
ncbi:MAG: efflux RND transporter periplasmic adaptor subunit [Raineya sp.]